VAGPGRAVTGTSPQAAPSGPALVFVDARHGWAAGSGGIFGTSDGGRRWRLELRAPVQVLEAVDARHAWAISGTTLLRTTDGAGWRTASHPGLITIDFVTRRHGYGLDRRGRLLSSSNGGVRWRLVRASPAQSFCATSAGLWVAYLRSVWARRGNRFVRVLRPRIRNSFTPELRCRGSAAWVLYEGGTVANGLVYYVYRSQDGGRRWRRVAVSDPGLQRFVPIPGDVSELVFDVVNRSDAVFASSCWACGYGRVQVSATVDGGAHWRIGRSFQDVFAEAISFQTSQVGDVILGRELGRPRSGAVWRTADGGRHWRLVLRSRAVGPP
jgi:photosystem II stability/assembly factor-like uncharacterized protein